jgi:hypothetical protein
MLGYGTWDSPGAFPGDIMEVIWYKRALSANDQSRVNSYLAIRNGVTLNSTYLSGNSTVVWDNTINAAFNNNIFAIAKDIGGALEQKISTSVNTGSILTAATTNNFILSNKDLARTALGNNQYQFFGDNNVTVTPLIAINPLEHPTLPAASQRIQRIWLTQEKLAAVSTIWLEANLASYTTTSNIIMIIADNAALTLNPTYITATSYSANKAVFNVDFGGTEKYFSFASLTSGLPVELLNFEGTPVENYNLLSWQTASETNNDYFTLEKSCDMVSWSEISKLNGAGNSTELLSYESRDFDKQKTLCPISYYRLWQTDFNGNKKLSGLICLQNNNNSEDVFSVFPNPSDESISILFNKKGMVKIEIRTINGELVYEENCMLNKQDVKTIATNAFAAGIYVLSVTTNQEVTTKNVIVY